MRQVVDFAFDPDAPSVVLPRGADVLAVSYRGKSPVLWVLCDCGNPRERRTFVVREHVYNEEADDAGQAVRRPAAGSYIGTLRREGRRPIHVFHPHGRRTAAAKARGRKHATTVYLDADVRERLAGRADAAGVPAAELTRRAIARYLEEES